MTDIASGIAMGLVATAAIDAWALVLSRAFGIRSLDFCLLGRWGLHMLDGVFVHQNIARSAAKPRECAVGWLAHYSIGVAFALVFVLLASAGWLARPTLLPALLFGLITVIVPMTTLQPALGMGLASSKTPHPGRARVRSLMTHAVFGVGLYLGAMVLMALRGAV
jgi:hypothetical protein